MKCDSGKNEFTRWAKILDVFINKTNPNNEFSNFEIRKKGKVGQK